MRDKMLLEVLLPATSRRYEFYVPLDLTVAQGAQMISRMLESRERSCYAYSSSCELMLLEGEDAGKVLDFDTTFRRLVARDELVAGMRVALM